MKNESEPTGITRRSFLKRSTVAVIAATNMMMFTGLVNAAGTHPSPAIPLDDSTNMWKCNVKKTRSLIQFPNNTQAQVFICTADSSCDLEITCGKMYVLNDLGNPEVLNGVKTTQDVKWKCDEKTYMSDDNNNEVEMPKTVVCLRSSI